MSKRVWILLSVIVLVAVIGGLAAFTSAYFIDTETSINNNVQAITNWFDLAWHYRKPINITNSNAYIVNDYRVQVTVDTSTLIPVKMQSGGNDIRFTDSTNYSTSLPYYIVSGIGTISTVIIVKVPALAASGITQIFMYYGNNSAPAISNLGSTYLFYDDFEDAGVGVSKWAEVNPGANRSTTRVNTQARTGTWSMYVNDSNGSQNYGVQLATPFATSGTGPLTVEYSARANQTNEFVAMRVLSNTLIGPHTRFGNTGANGIQYYDTAWHLSQAYINTSWFDFDLQNINYSGATDTYNLTTVRVGNGNTVTTNGVRFDSNRNVASLNQIYFTTTTGSQTPQIWVDDVKVYGYAAVAPSAGAAGLEQ